jgi:hypothetical protein
VALRLFVACFSSHCFLFLPHAMLQARNRIKDKATLRWCTSFTTSIGVDPSPYSSLEDFVSDGWGLIILLGMLPMMAHETYIRTVNRFSLVP